MLIRVWPLQLNNRDEVKAEDEDEVEDEVVVVGTVGEDEVVDVDATTIIYLMISIGTLINLPTINWSQSISLVVNYKVDSQALPSTPSTPSPVVPPAVTTTIRAVSDALSTLTTPTRQVHTTHVTPSTGGSTSAQMDSGPPTLLCQMMSSASA